MRDLRLVTAALLAFGLAGCAAGGSAGVKIFKIIPSKSPLRVVRTRAAQVANQPAEPSVVSSVTQTSATRIYALAQSPTYPPQQSSLLASTNGGQSWQRVATLPGATQAIDFVDAQHGFARTSDALLATVDGGRIWRTVIRASFTHVQFVTAADGVATTQQGALRITRDGGRTWRTALARTGLYFDALSALPGPRYYALGSGLSRSPTRGPELFESADGGQTWQRLFSGIDSPALHGAYLAYLAHFRGQFVAGQVLPTFREGIRVTFTTPSVGWLSLSDGGFLATLVARTTDGGRRWTFAWGNAGCAMGCNGMGGGLFPAAYLGTQYAWRYDLQSIDRSSDGGATFMRGGPLPLGLPASNAVYSLKFVTPELGIAGTKDGILRTADAGRTWSRVWPDGPGPLRQISMTASGYGLAVPQGQPDVLWRTEDGGRSWRMLRSFPYKVRSEAPELGVPPEISAFWALPGGGALVLAGPTFYRSGDAGRSWRVIALHLPSTSPYGFGTLWFASAEVGWYYGETRAGSAQIYRTADGGRTWRRSSVISGTGPLICQPIGQSDGWCLHGLRSGDKPAYWKMALSGTTDSGRHFVPVGTLAMSVPITSISYFSPAAGALLETHDILLTRNAGRTFTDLRITLLNQFLPHQVDDVSPSDIYVVTDAGRLFVSRDGGRHWRQIG